MYEHQPCMNFYIGDLLHSCPWQHGNSSYATAQMCRTTIHQTVTQYYSDKLGMIYGDSVDSGCSEHVLIGAGSKKLSAYRNED